MQTAKRPKILRHPRIYKFKKETCIKMTRMRRKQIKKRLAWRTFLGQLILISHPKRMTLAIRVHLQARLPKDQENLMRLVQCAHRDLRSCSMIVGRVLFAKAHDLLPFYNLTNKL